MPSHRSHSNNRARAAAAAEARAAQAQSPNPDDGDENEAEDQEAEEEPAFPLRAARLAALSSLANKLASLQANFVPPPSGSLVFQPGTTKLAFAPANSGVLAHEDALVKLLTKLDAVYSEGDDEVRQERKRVVKEVDAELERLDGLKKVELEHKAKRDQVREKKERVDEMLRKAGAKAPAEPQPTSHQVAEEILNNNPHGKRAEAARGRGSPISGDEGTTIRPPPNGSSPSNDRYSKIRRQESPSASRLPPSLPSFIHEVDPPQRSRGPPSFAPSTTDPFAPMPSASVPFFASLPSRFDGRR